MLAGITKKLTASAYHPSLPFSQFSASLETQVTGEVTKAIWVADILLADGAVYVAHAHANANVIRITKVTIDWQKQCNFFFLFLKKLAEKKKN